MINVKKCLKHKLCHDVHNGLMKSIIYFISGFYMFIETSDPRKQGDIARLISPSYTASPVESCLEFWYHMYGTDTGTLNVYKDSTNTRVWTKSGTGKWLFLQRFYFCCICSKQDFTKINCQ